MSFSLWYTFSPDVCATKEFYTKCTSCFDMLMVDADEEMLLRTATVTASTTVFYGQHSNIGLVMKCVAATWAHETVQGLMKHTHVKQGTHGILIVVAPP